MALINLEIEVPGTKTCDISALKRFLTDSASKYLERAAEAHKAKDATEDPFACFSGDWGGDKSAHQIADDLREARYFTNDNRTW